jgi:hypothetical protein
MMKCTKRIHQTPRAAEACIRSMQRSGKTIGRLRCYYCKKCDGFHIGHIDKKMSLELAKIRSSST